MSGAESTARQRRPQKAAPAAEVDAEDEEHEENDTLTMKPSATKTKKTPRAKVDDEDAYSPYLDVFRVLTFLLLASCGLSYLISGGESWFWGMKNRPDYLKLSWWKQQYVGGSDLYPTGPLYLTLDELAAYDGTDPDKPIYLSINGTIFDVSAGRRIYGPGGSYHWFAGVDASRGFVTGCFAADRTGDLRGVEEMFLPLDNPEVDSHWTAEELEQKKKEELEEAHQKVHEAIQHWVDFFHKSPKYPYVGQLVREPGWEGERKELCKIAADGRIYRKVPGQEES